MDAAADNSNNTQGNDKDNVKVQLEDDNHNHHNHHHFGGALAERHAATLFMASFILDEEYNRIWDIGSNEKKSIHQNYGEFYDFNLRCIEESSDEDRNFLMVICRRLQVRSIEIMHMVDCIKSGADSFYFSKDKTICLCSSR